MAQDAKPLVIVGGGFAGTATLLHMILKAANNPDASSANPVRITMVERAPEQLFGGIEHARPSGLRRPVPQLRTVPTLSAF